MPTLPALSYYSVRFIKVTHTPLAIAKYLLMILIFCYVIIFQIIVNKGYQEYDRLVGTVFIKTKGAGRMQGGVLDSNDFVFPPTEQNGLIVGTSIATTSLQTQGTCPGNLFQEQCQSDADCVKKNGTFTEHGQILAVCAPAADNETQRYCMVQAWCPTEPDKVIQQQISNVQETTIWAVSNVVFPKFEMSFSTADPTNGTGALYPNGYAFFTAGIIVREAGATWADVTRKGAMILVNIVYDCDLNQDHAKCQPTFTFTRLDTASPGFNFRFLEYNTLQDGKVGRTLKKVVGVRILFQVGGRAGKFSIVALLLAIGSGMGLMSISTVICDFALLYLLSNKSKYAKTKFAPVDVAEGGQAVHYASGGEAKEAAPNVSEVVKDDEQADEQEMVPLKS